MDRGILHARVVARKRSAAGPQRIFERAVKPGDVVYDIGANVGPYTLLASSLVGAAGRVVAIEPFPANLDYLKRHLALNHVSNVQIVEGAAYENDGKVRLSEGTCGSTVHLETDGHLQVDAFALDSLIYDKGYPAPGVIKMNVEGAEYAVLKGARRLLLEKKLILLLSTHGPKVREQCLGLLADLGYSIQPLDAGIPAEASEFLVEFLVEIEDESQTC